MSVSKKLESNEVERLILLYLKGGSFRRVAKSIGVSVSTVQHHLKKNGIPTRSMADYFEPKEFKEIDAKKRKKANV